MSRVFIFTQEHGQTNSQLLYRHRTPLELTNVDKMKKILIENGSDSDVPVRHRSRFMCREQTSFELGNDEFTNVGTNTFVQKSSGMQEDPEAAFMRKLVASSIEQNIDQSFYYSQPTVTEEKTERDYTAFSNLLLSLETETAIQERYPASLRPDYRPSLALCGEAAAIDKLLEQDHSQRPLPCESDEYTEYLLSDFEVYNDIRNRYPGQFADLHTVASEESLEFLFDGLIEGHRSSFWVQSAYINTVSIGGLQDRRVHTSSTELYVQSQEGCRKSIWYRLGQPSTRYASTFHNFQWIADLTKHFIDYLEYCNGTGKDVQLKDFEVDFNSKLAEWHEEHQRFFAWTQAGQVTREHITKYARFLKDQVYDLEYAACPATKDPYDGPMFRHTVWKQICPDTFPSGRQTLTTKYLEFDEKTVVTQDVFETFSHRFTHWTKKGYGILVAVQPSPEVAALRLKRLKELGFPEKSVYGKRNSTISRISLAAAILKKVGTGHTMPRRPPRDLVNKVIIARKRPLSTNKIRGRCSKAPGYEIRYAFVCKTRIYEKRTCLVVVWLHNVDSISTLKQAYYAYENELFLSAECCCKPIDLSQVIGVFDVAIFTRPTPENFMFFIMQTYFEDEERIVTATACHLKCRCISGKRTERGPREQNEMSPSAEVSNCSGPILKAMSLFTGSGLFDRGLEASGAIVTIDSIDSNEFAMQTNIANQKYPAHNVTGDVNMYLVELAAYGMINPDLIAGSPPCNGFTNANQHKGTKKCNRQCSLVACMVSFISLLLPFFALIENVPYMDSGDPNACSQTMCFLVSLGYQVGKFFISGIDLDAPQQRERLFILAVAPGVPFPANPRPFIQGVRKRTVGNAIRGMPPITNDTTINVQLPDHITLRRLDPVWSGVNIRGLIEKIPHSPAKMNLPKMRAAGQLTEDEERWLSEQTAEAQSKNSRAWTRIDVGKPFPAIITTVKPQCARLGKVLHPFENRIFSLEEAKRACGVPAGFVLIGPPSEQLRQLGNMVVFQVGAAFGRVIGESWHSWLADQKAKVDHSQQSKSNSSAGASGLESQWFESEAVQQPIQQGLMASVPSPSWGIKRERSVLVESDSDDVQVARKRRVNWKSRSSKTP